MLFVCLQSLQMIKCFEILSLRVYGNDFKILTHSCPLTQELESTDHSDML